MLVRLPLARLAACAASLLASLAACDSGRPDASASPDPLVGTWALVETVAATSLMASESQTIVDEGGTPEGTVTFSGAESGALRFFSITTDGAVLTSYNPALNVPDGARYELQLSTSGPATFYATQSSGSFADYAVFRTAPAFTYADGRIAVERVVLQRGGFVTVAAGTLAFPRVALAAGQPTIARTSTLLVGDDPSDPAVSARFVFAADGAYRFEQTLAPGGVQTVRGTWTAGDGRLRLTPAGGPVQTLAYTIEAQALRLTGPPEPCPDAACLRRTEAEFGVRGGTLLSAEVQTTTVLSRASQ